MQARLVGNDCPVEASRCVVGGESSVTGDQDCSLRFNQGVDVDLATDEDATCELAVGG